MKAFGSNCDRTHARAHSRVMGSKVTAWRGEAAAVRYPRQRVRHGLLSKPRNAMAAQRKGGRPHESF